MRALAALGAISFAYLAVIPGALVWATADPACESCGHSTAVSVYLVLAFAASSVILAGAAISLAAFAARPSTRTEALVGRSLRISAAAVGVLLLSEFALVYPVAAAVIVPASALGGWLITRGRRPSTGRPRAPG